MVQKRQQKAATTCLFITIFCSSLNLCLLYFIFLSFIHSLARSLVSACRHSTYTYLFTHSQIYKLRLFAIADFFRELCRYATLNGWPRAPACTQFLEVILLLSLALRLMLSTLHNNNNHYCYCYVIALENQQPKRNVVSMIYHHR